MRKKFAITCLLLAWLCANGALLDMVQVFAWGKMFSGYAKTMPVATALRETFDPAKPCEMCIGVANAKEELSQRNLPATAERDSHKLLLLACDAPAAFILANPPERWPAILASTAPSRSESVPVPPPRA